MTIRLVRLLRVHTFNRWLTRPDLVCSIIESKWIAVITYHTYFGRPKYKSHAACKDYLQTNLLTSQLIRVLVKYSKKNGALAKQQSPSGIAPPCFPFFLARYSCLHMYHRSRPWRKAPGCTLCVRSLRPLTPCS